MHLIWGNHYDLLNLSQTTDVVCPSKSDASKDPSPDNADPSAHNDDKLQGTIQSPPNQNDTESGSIRS